MKVKEYETMGDAHNVLVTNRTYASYKNALEALGRAADKVGVYNYRYLIAANADGRFAPVVFFEGRSELVAFVHNGVTVVG